MFLESTYTRISQLWENAYDASSVLRGIVRMLRFTFVTGPALFFKSGLQPKDAVLMIALSISALLSIGLLVVPAFLFPSPLHNEYFEFSRMLQESTARDFMLTVAAACTFIAMILPAAHLPLASARK